VVTQIEDVDAHKKHRKLSFVTDESTYTVKFSADATAALEIVSQLWRSVKKSSTQHQGGSDVSALYESSDDLLTSTSFSESFDDSTKPILAMMSPEDMEFLFRAAEVQIERVSVCLSGILYVSCVWVCFFFFFCLCTMCLFLLCVLCVFLFCVFACVFAEPLPLSLSL
jgi:hypothetical protein